MIRAKKLKITLQWLKDNGILLVEHHKADDTYGECDLHFMDHKSKRWQFDIYKDYMDMTLSTWGKDDGVRDVLEDDFTSLIEICGIPFASDPMQLDSLMELTDFKIKK